MTTNCRNTFPSSASTRCCSFHQSSQLFLHLILSSTVTINQFWPFFFFTWSTRPQLYFTTGRVQCNRGKSSLQWDVRVQHDNFCLRANGEREIVHHDGQSYVWHASRFDTSHFNVTLWTNRSRQPSNTGSRNRNRRGRRRQQSLDFWLWSKQWTRILVQHGHGRIKLD